VPSSGAGERDDVRAVTAWDRDGGDDGNARRFQILEVSLVEVPVEDLAGVAEKDAALDTCVEPRPELLEAHEIVPRCTDDHGVEGEPVDSRVAPDRRSRIDLDLVECGDQ